MFRGLNRRAALVGALGLVLVSGQAHASAASKIVERLATFKGRPVADVFEKLGYPDRKETFGPDTVYYWGVDQPDGPSCTFNVATGPDGLVKKFTAYGNDWGCSAIAKSLKP